MADSPRRDPRATPSASQARQRSTADDHPRQSASIRGWPFCVLCTAIKAFHSFSRGSLSGHFGKLVDVGVACCEQSGDDTLSGFGKLVTMSAADFLQDSMGSQ